MGKVGVDLLVRSQGGMVSEDQIVENAAIEEFLVVGEIVREAFGFKADMDFYLFLVFLLQGANGIAIVLEEGIVSALVGLREIRKHGVVGKTEDLKAAADGLKDIILVFAAGMAASLGVRVVIACKHKMRIV